MKGIGAQHYPYAPSLSNNPTQTLNPGLYTYQSLHHGFASVSVQTVGRTCRLLTSCVIVMCCSVVLFGLLYCCDTLLCYIAVRYRCGILLHTIVVL